MNKIEKARQGQVQLKKLENPMLKHIFYKWQLKRAQESTVVYDFYELRSLYDIHKHASVYEEVLHTYTLRLG